MLWANVHAHRANIIVTVAMNIHADESSGPVVAISRAGDNVTRWITIETQPGQFPF